ncbi:hypothetical protein [Amycolatopsis taiwanensis]|uniref:hypothetical protein n=1 Tax=Amycolatopsis taiwanensis TaxID=342230 RepID=UPI0004869DAA|nr:hypothetical protein [Amycolatopsis taiwanensis]
MPRQIMVVFGFLFGAVALWLGLSLWSGNSASAAEQSGHPPVQATHQVHGAKHAETSRAQHGNARKSQPKTPGKGERRKGDNQRKPDRPRRVESCHPWPETHPCTGDQKTQPKMPGKGEQRKGDNQRKPDQPQQGENRRNGHGHPWDETHPGMPEAHPGKETLPGLDGMRDWLNPKRSEDGRLIVW